MRSVEPDWSNLPKKWLGPTVTNHATLVHGVRTLYDAVEIMRAVFQREKLRAYTNTVVPATLFIKGYETLVYFDTAGLEVGCYLPVVGTLMVHNTRRNWSADFTAGLTPAPARDVTPEGDVDGWVVSDAEGTVIRDEQGRAWVFASEKDAEIEAAEQMMDMLQEVTTEQRRLSEADLSWAPQQVTWNPHTGMAVADTDETFPGVLHPPKNAAQNGLPDASSLPASTSA